MSDATGTAWSVKSSDDVVFGDFYRRHHRAIRDFCRRRVASDCVDDAVAETFLVAWRRLDEVPPGDQALVWLYRVAYRVIGHHWRSTARRNRLHVRLRSVGRRPVSTEDRSVADDDKCQLILQAAARLGDTDAEVLRLVAWEQLTIAEIATVVGIAPNAVKQRLHRAKRNLAREYGRLESQAATPTALTGGM
jgi:RNA polymerase sigma-70 factor (ECF subfamily)